MCYTSSPFLHTAWDQYILDFCFTAIDENWIGIITDIVWLPSLSLSYSKSGIWRVPLLWFQLQESPGSSSDEEAEEEDVDVALKKEVAQLKASGTKQQRRFQAMESGANNVIFIRTQNLGKRLTERTVSALSLKCNVTIMFILLCALESDKLVHHILSDLHTTKKKKSRVILRMLPVRI